MAKKTNPEPKPFDGYTGDIHREEPKLIHLTFAQRMVARLAQTVGLWVLPIEQTHHWTRQACEQNTLCGNMDDQPYPEGISLGRSQALIHVNCTLSAYNHYHRANPELNL